MEKGKNIMTMKKVVYIMKENIYMKKNGMEKDMMNMVILYMN